MKSPSPRHALNLARYAARAQALRRALSAAGIAAATVLLLAWTLHPNLHTAPGPFVWWVLAVGSLLILAAGLASWFAGPRPVEAARHLDVQMGAKNRLEAAWELQSAHDPVAALQREDASAFAHRVGRPSRPSIWISCAAVAVVAALLGGLAGRWGYVSQRSHAQSAHQQPDANPPALPPEASIHVVTPAAEFQANPIAEIPVELEIVAECALTNLAFHIDVNGARTFTIPLSGTNGASLAAAPGAQRLDPSFYLDELQVEPFDMVAWHVRAERIWDQPLPPVASRLNFIQIRPLRRDLAILERQGDGVELDLIHRLGPWKLEQIHLIRRNFVLQTTELSRHEPLWQQENDAVRVDQQALHNDVETAIPELIRSEVSPTLIDLLKQALPHLAEAATALSQTNNRATHASQHQALALFTAIEKSVLKTIIINPTDPRPAPPSPARVRDPFSEKERFELKPYEETAAARLDVVAQQQTALVADLAQLESRRKRDEPLSPDASSELGDRQTHITSDLSALVGMPKFANAVRGFLVEARDAASEASLMLGAGDSEAAVEPATRTLARIEQAIRERKRASRAGASDSMLITQRKLVDVLTVPGSGTAPPSRDEIDGAMNAEAERLANEAQDHQGGGDPESAQALMDLANRLAQAAGAGRTPGAVSSDAEPLDLEQFAAAIARERAELASRADLLAESLRELQDAERGLRGLARNAPSQPTPSAESGTAPNPTASPGASPGSSPGQTSAGPSPGSGLSGQPTRASDRQNSALPSSSAPERAKTEDRLDAYDQLLVNAQVALLTAQAVEGSEQLADAAGEFGHHIQQQSGNGGNERVAIQLLIEPLARAVRIVAGSLERLNGQIQLSHFDRGAAPPGWETTVDSYFQRLSEAYEAERAAPSAAPQPPSLERGSR